jgi:hypothetical protein
MPPVNRPRPVQKPRPQTAKTPSGSGAAWGIVVTIIALALVGGGYFSYPYLKKWWDERQHQPVSVKNDAPPTDTTAVVQPVVEKPDIVVRQESSASAPGGYYIIVGSFRIKDNADNMVKNTRKDIKLEVLYFEEIDAYRVSAGRYDNIHAAYNDTYSVRDLDGCASAWVLENR